jgi:hypothetical protein
MDNGLVHEFELYPLDEFKVLLQNAAQAMAHARTKQLINTVIFSERKT